MVLVVVVVVVVMVVLLMFEVGSGLQLSAAPSSLGWLLHGTSGLSLVIENRHGREVRTLTPGSTSRQCLPKFSGRSVS